MIVFVVVGSWWLEFAFRLNVLRNPRRVLTTIAAVAPVFLVWDGYAISQGHWFFDPALTLGVVGPLGIPLEEYLFFIVPEVFHLGPAQCATVSYTVSYTTLAALAAAVALVLELTVIRSGLLRKGRFYAAYGIIVVFQFLTNGYLTKTGIVDYDPGAIIGWRIFLAPVEDLLFGTDASYSTDAITAAATAGATRSSRGLGM
eukprot:gene49142-60152_t